MQRHGWRSQLYSIRGRLLLVIITGLALFLLISAWVLEQAFVAGLRTQLQARLSAHIYTLLTAADETRPGELFVPEYLPDERMNEFGSGLYAFIADAHGHLVWRSASTLNLEEPQLASARPGEIRFGEQQLGGESLLTASYDAVWEPDSRYTLSVMQTTSDLRAAQHRFRSTLWSWLGGLSVLFLLLMWSVVRWGTKPLREVARAVRAVEHGEAERLEGDFPRELLPLTDNINLFIESERGQRQRYAETMANLAHSLKTPLAVLNSCAQTADTEQLRTQVAEQVERMNSTVRYQLQRAVARGRAPFATRVDVTVTLDKLLDALRKVYADKQLSLERQITGEPQFLGEGGDLMEILGNLLDNACKWASQRVRCHVFVDAGRTLCIEIQDDGPGIATEQVDAVLQRGGRLDTQKEGQGIGLAVVREIIVAYRGELSIARSEWGGAQLSIRLPM